MAQPDGTDIIAPGLPHEHAVRGCLAIPGRFRTERQAEGSPQQKPGSSLAPQLGQILVHGRHRSVQLQRSHGDVATVHQPAVAVRNIPVSLVGAADPVVVAPAGILAAEDLGAVLPVSLRRGADAFDQVMGKLGTFIFSIIASGQERGLCDQGLLGKMVEALFHHLAEAIRAATA